MPWEAGLETVDMRVLDVLGVRVEWVENGLTWGKRAHGAKVGRLWTIPLSVCDEASVIVENK
jgi:hypothetical protein